MHFNSLEVSMSSYLCDYGANDVKVFALDDFFKDKEPPNYIKADLEGAEQDMVQGSARLIKNFKPKMTLSIYHRSDDIVKVPEMIKDLNCSYNFAVRTHSSNFEDTVLYCYQIRKLLWQIFMKNKRSLSSKQLVL